MFNGLIAYLESLTLRAYFIVYGTRTTFGGWARSFFGGGLSRAVQAISFDVLVALAFMIIGALVGFTLVESDPQGETIMSLHFRGHGLAHVREEQFNFLSGFIQYF